MSIYDERESPAYEDNAPVYHNANFDKWWSAAHDQMMADLIEEHQWHWYWEIPNAIKNVTPENVMIALEQQHAWYNKVMNYAVTRAKRLGITSRIRNSEWKECPLCGKPFREDSLPGPLVKRLGGMQYLNFCSPCLTVCVFPKYPPETGKKARDKTTKTEIIDYINRLTVALERIPAQNVGEGMYDLIDLPFDKRVNLFRVLKDKPSLIRIKEVFGSWLKALIAAGVLVDGTRETSRGTHTIALDGHTCLSLGEKTIDDFLYARGIAHEKEPKYPEGNYRADFLVGSVFIEYFGLAGNETYDAKIKEKMRLCQAHGIKLIALYPRDLLASAKLEKKLVELLDG
jgi:hypothetical protein